MLNNQDFLVPAAAVVKKETKKSVDIGTEREDWSQELVEVDYCTDARHSSSSCRHPKNILNDFTNKRAYSELTKE